MRIVRHKLAKATVVLFIVTNGKVKNVYRIVRVGNGFTVAMTNDTKMGQN